MLLTNNSLHCCCRTLLRTTLNCKQQPHTSVIKRFSHRSSLFLPKVSSVLFETITRGTRLPVCLSIRCSSYATSSTGYATPTSSYATPISCRLKMAALTAWCPAPVTKRWSSHSGLPSSALPSLNFDILKDQKFDEDVLLYYNDNKKECVVYNVIALIVVALLTYGTYKIYCEADLEPVEDDDWANIDLLVDKFVPFYRHFNLAPYREVLCGALLLIGLSFLGIILRYTLRSVSHLTLLKDGKTIAFTTNNVWGRSLTRRVPVSQAHTKDLNDLIRGYESGQLVVQGTLVPYVLEVRGQLCDPFLLRQYLGTAEENKNGRLSN